MKKTIIGVGLALIGLLLASCEPHLQGRIVFSSDRDSPTNFEIYVVDADGNNLVRLTQNETSDIEPSWSPDGKRIAFASNRDGDYDIYVMDADGGNVVQLTGGEMYNQLYDDKEPAWAPSGERIAFTSQRDGDWDIYVMDADGSNVVKLTDNWVQDYNPTWSPDGNHLAFVARRDDLSIYIMSGDGNNPPVELIEHSLDEPPGSLTRNSCPAWSPDGERIAFISALSNTTPASTGLYVVDIDGSNITRLGDRRSGCPAWSPDGKHIVFICDSNDICVIEADGSTTITLLETKGQDAYQPDWTP